MDKEEIETINHKIRQYTWYHNIQIAPGVHTYAVHSEYNKVIWDFILKCMENVDFNNKRVLDVGCRDGLFSFEAEKRGAKEVIGIDNDISSGALELLIPLFKSKVKMYELNLYELEPESFGTFDIILCFGVLYHLRYPIAGLKKMADCLPNNGLLVLESGMLNCKELENMELLYCPFENSPYEPTSVSFFNKAGLCATMRSIFLQLTNFYTLESISSEARAAGQGINYDVIRQLFVFEKRDSPKNHFFTQYWHSTHIFHSKDRQRQITYQEKLEEIYNSMSWRITKPLRVVGKYIKPFLRRK